MLIFNATKAIILEKVYIKAIFWLFELFAAVYPAAVIIFIASYNIMLHEFI